MHSPEPQLGVPGFRYADLHDAGRLADLTRAFDGEPHDVFSCFDQDQPMDVMDWDNLRMRLRGNSLQEKLSSLWLDYLLQHATIARV